MRKYILCSVIFIFITLPLFCSDNISINIKEAIEQYIDENELPVIISEEIIIYNDFNIIDKTNFQVYMLNLLNIFINEISEGNITNEVLEKVNEISRIYIGFYNYCEMNDYELAIIIPNKYKVINDYLEYSNFYLTYYDNLIILDNSTYYAKLEDLVDYLLQIGEITKNNLVNYFCHNWEDKMAYIYKKILFFDGTIKTIDIEYFVYDPYHDEAINGYFELSYEIGLIEQCYSMIGSICYLFKVKNYDYEEMRNKLLEKYSEYKIIIENERNNISQ